MNRGLNDFFTQIEKKKVSKTEARYLAQQIVDMLEDDSNFGAFRFYTYSISGICDEWTEDKDKLVDNGLTKIFNRNSSIKSLLLFKDETEKIDYEFRISTWHDSGLEVYDVDVYTYIKNPETNYIEYVAPHKLNTGDYPK